jgi:OFA family oxalate/formate antiporter-like MFS transporter
MIMTAAGFLLGLGYLLMSQLSSIWQLFLFYGVISIGMSAAVVPILSTIARWFVKMRAFMTGIVLASTGIALMVIVPAANQAILHYGWRTVYMIVGSVVLVVVVISAQFLRRNCPMAVMERAQPLQVRELMDSLLKRLFVPNKCG